MNGKLDDHIIKRLQEGDPQAVGTGIIHLIDQIFEMKNRQQVICEEQKILAENQELTWKRSMVNRWILMGVIIMLIIYGLIPEHILRLL